MNQASSFIAAQKLLSFAGFLRYITFQIFLQNYNIILNYRNIYVHFLLNPLCFLFTLTLSIFFYFSVSLFLSPLFLSYAHSLSPFIFLLTILPTLFSLSLSCSLSPSLTVFSVARLTLPLIQSMRQSIKTWHSRSPTTSSTLPTTLTWRETNSRGNLQLMHTSERFSKAVDALRWIAGTTVSDKMNTCHWFEHNYIVSLLLWMLAHSLI